MNKMQTWKHYIWLTFNPTLTLVDFYTLNSNLTLTFPYTEVRMCRSNREHFVGRDVSIDHKYPGMGVYSEEIITVFRILDFRIWTTCRDQVTRLH